MLDRIEKLETILIALTRELIALKEQVLIDTKAETIEQRAIRKIKSFQAMSIDELIAFTNIQKTAIRTKASNLNIKINHVTSEFDYNDSVKIINSTRSKSKFAALQ